MKVFKRHFFITVIAVIAIISVFIIFREDSNEKNVMDKLGNNIECYDSNATWIFDVQAEPLLRKSSNLHWYPLINDKLVLLVNKNTYDDQINSFDKLIKEGIYIILRDKYPDNIFLMLSVAYSDSYRYDADVAIEILNNLDKLKVSSACLCNQSYIYDKLMKNNAAYLCFYHEAKNMIEKYDKLKILKILKIDENLPTLGYGILSTEKIEEFENENIKIRGFTDDIDEFNRASKKIISYINKSEYSTDITLFSKRILSYLLTLLITIFWLSMNIKYIQSKRIRRSLMLQLFFLISWLFLKIINSMIYDADVNRMCWYFYFIAISYIPMFSLYITYICDKKENFVLNKIMYMWMILTFMVIFIILTNDVHNCFIRFNDRKNFQYEYGFIFYIYVANAITQLLGSIYLIVVKTIDSPRKKRVLAPILVCLIFIIYVINCSNKYSAIFEPSLSIAWIIFSLSLIQAEIYTGIIQTNNKYIDMFNYSTLDMSIYDDEDRLVYNSAGMNNQGKSRKMHINSGYITWRENNEALEEKKRQLENAVVQLNYEYDLLKQAKDIEEKKLTLMTRKKIYSKVEEVVLSKVSKITALLTSLEKNNAYENYSEVEKTLVLVEMILCYIKKKSHLLIHEQQYSLIEACDVNIAISEIIEYANKTDSTVGFIFELQYELSVIIAIYIYDFIENLIESMIILNDVTLLIRVEKKSSQFLIIIIADEEIDYLPLQNSMIRNYGNVVIDFEEYNDDRFVLKIILEEIDE